MVESQLRIACLREVEDLARMTEQHRQKLALLWLKLKDLDAAIQFSKDAKEVGKRSYFDHDESFGLKKN